MCRHCVRLLHFSYMHTHLYLPGWRREPYLSVWCLLVDHIDTLSTLNEIQEQEDCVCVWMWVCTYLQQQWLKHHSVT